MATTDYILMTLDSEREFYECAMRQAELEQDTAHMCEQVKSGAWTVEEARRYLLADALKEFAEMAIDDMPVATWVQSFRATLARHAFELIDWHGMADHYLRKVAESRANS